NRRSAGSVVDDHPEVVTIIKPKIPAGPGYRYLYILTEVDKHGVARTRAGLRAQDSIERKLRTLGHNGRKRQYHLRSTADHHRVIRVHNDEGNRLIPFKKHVRFADHFKRYRCRISRDGYHEGTALRRVNGSIMRTVRHSCCCE